MGLKKLTNDWLGEEESWFACLIYLSLPLVIYWSRDAMLEVPAMALIIWSFYCFQRYLKENLTKYLVWWAIFAALSPYTKQNTVFIYPAFLLSALLSNNLGKIADRRFLIALCGLFLCSIPLLFTTFKWGMFNIKQSFGNLNELLTPIEHIVFYFKCLPSSVGWVILGMSAAGLFFLGKKRIGSSQISKIGMSIFFCWTTVCYLQMVLIKIKEPRHGFFWMPIFAILAAVGLKNGLSGIPLKRWGKALGGILIIGIFCNNLINSEVNWSQGFNAPAAYLKSQWDGNAILINIFRDAHFSFRLRAIDDERNFRVYRSDKIFESVAVYKQWGVKPLISLESELLCALTKYGIRFLLIQEPMPFITPVEKLIRQVVKTDKFEKVKDFQIICPGNGEATLHLYRFNGNIDTPGVIPPIHLPVVGMIIGFQKIPGVEKTSFIMS